MTLKPLFVAVSYFVVMIIVAHFFAPPGYILKRNTISELGSQGHTYKWIMQAGFIGFGILLAGGLVLKSRTLGRVNPPDILILFYGLSILMTGIFCAAPINNSLAYSAKEAQLHSIFATVAGISLSLGILWYLIAASSTPERIYHLVFLVLVIGLSMLFGLAENGTLPVGQGIVQRVMYLAAFIWLVRL
jgi:hypothetical membrane protein